LTFFTWLLPKITSLHAWFDRFLPPVQYGANHPFKFAARLAAATAGNMMFRNGSVEPPAETMPTFWPSRSSAGRARFANRLAATRFGG
jgi:hypothetical protein